MKTARLPAENHTFTIGKTETHPGWPVTVSLCRHPKTGVLKEVVFVDAGKAGSQMNLMFSDLGIGFSRILQGRDPQSGNRFEGSDHAKIPSDLGFGFWGVFGWLRILKEIGRKTG